MKQRCLWTMIVAITLSIGHGFAHSGASPYAFNGPYSMTYRGFQRILPKEHRIYTYYLGYKCYIFCVFREKNVRLCPEFSCKKDPNCKPCIDNISAFDISANVCSKECEKSPENPYCPQYCITEIANCTKLCGDSDCPAQPCWPEKANFCTRDTRPPIVPPNRTEPVRLCYIDRHEIHPLAPRTSLTWIYISIGIMIAICAIMMVFYICFTTLTDQKELIVYSRSDIKPMKSSPRASEKGPSSRINKV